MFVQGRNNYYKGTKNVLDKMHPQENKERHSRNNIKTKQS